jgi:sterol desaturase/sphingolipid hydroxylase (fatty acid hydroxylase superfamily)
MFGLPITISSLLVYFKVAEMNTHISYLLTFVSITGGFLFNLLALIHSVIEKVNAKPDEDEVKKLYSKEIHSNIAFGIFIAILASIVLIAFSFKTPFLRIESIIVNFTLWWIYFTLFVFLLNLLLILKKVFILLDNP